MATKVKRAMSSHSKENNKTVTLKSLEKKGELRKSKKSLCEKEKAEEAPPFAHRSSSDPTIDWNGTVDKKKIKKKKSNTKNCTLDEGKKNVLFGGEPVTLETVSPRDKRKHLSSNSNSKSSITPRRFSQKKKEQYRDEISVVSRSRSSDIHTQSPKTKEKTPLLSKILTPATTQPTPSASTRRSKHSRSFSDSGRSSRINNKKPAFETLRIKCVWNNDKRFIWVKETVTIEEFLNSVREKYDLPFELSQFKFRDPTDEQDLMTITTEADLGILFASERKELFIVLCTPPNTPIKTRKTWIGHATEFSKRTNGIRSSPPTGSRELDFYVEPNSLKRRSTPTCREMIDHPNHQFNIPANELIITSDSKVLGYGYFGEVRLGMWRSKTVACKRIYEKTFKNAKDINNFCREVKLLSELRHPNVVLFLGSCTDGKDKIIVTEYCEKGSLSLLLKNQKLDPPTQLKIARDIALGMNHLHHENVLHRDLTSANILLSASLEAKVSDFGLSRREPPDGLLSCTMGSVPWMAPEVIDNAKNFTKKSDVYSYAIILWEIQTGKDPCPPEMSSIMLATKVLNEKYRPSIPDTVPIEWLQLIEKCWHQDSHERPNFSEILNTLDNFDYPGTLDLPPTRLSYSSSISEGDSPVPPTSDLLTLPIYSIRHRRLSSIRSPHPSGEPQASPVSSPPPSPTTSLPDSPSTSFALETLSISAPVPLPEPVTGLTEPSFSSNAILQTYSAPTTPPATTPPQTAKSRSRSSSRSSTGLSRITSTSPSIISNSFPRITIIESSPSKFSKEKGRRSLKKT